MVCREMHVFEDNPIGTFFFGLECMEESVFSARALIIVL
jgi:hypothetical protein